MMHSSTLLVLLACLAGVVLCQTESPAVVCQEGWNITCTRPLSQFTQMRFPKKFCKSIGYFAKDLCHIVPGSLVTPNGCCEYGK